MAILRWNQALGPKLEFHISRETKTRSNSVAYHGHDFAEVFWVDAGQGKHRVNGKTFALKAGQMIFIRPTDFHGIETRQTGSLTITNVAFTQKTLRFMRERYFPNSTRWFWSKGTFPMVYELDSQRLAELTQIADRLAADPRKQFYVERFLMNLLYRIELRESHSLPTHAPDWLLNACQKMESPEYFQQGVKAFVKIAGRCHEHVTRVCGECLGESPIDYINRKRIQFAARQLEMTDKSIMEIAFDCGLTNLSHFYKLFRSVHKISPRRYRVARQALN